MNSVIKLQHTTLYKKKKKTECKTNTKYLGGFVGMSTVKSSVYKRGVWYIS